MDIIVFGKIGLVIFLIFAVGKKIFSDEKTMKIFAGASYFTTMLLVIGGVVEISNRLEFTDIAFELTCLDILSLISGIYIFFYLTERFRKGKR